jgi:hypothetical protein
MWLVPLGGSAIVVLLAELAIVLARPATWTYVAGSLLVSLGEAVVYAGVGTMMGTVGGWRVALVAGAATAALSMPGRWAIGFAWYVTAVLEAGWGALLGVAGAALRGPVLLPSRDGGPRPTDSRGQGCLAHERRGRGCAVRRLRGPGGDCVADD